MDAKTKEAWTSAVSELDIPSQDIYLLLNPQTDTAKYFELVEKIANEQIFTLDHEGKVLENKKKTFRILAASYLLELEKDKSWNNNLGNNLWVQPQTYPQTYPVYPTNIPGYPIVTDPAPWRPDVVYCTSTHQINS